MYEFSLLPSMIPTPTDETVKLVRAYRASCVEYGKLLADVEQGKARKGSNSLGPNGDPRCRAFYGTIGELSGHIAEMFSLIHGHWGEPRTGAVVVDEVAVCSRFAPKATQSSLCLSTWKHILTPYSTLPNSCFPTRLTPSEARIAKLQTAYPFSDLDPQLCTHSPQH